MFSPLSKTPFLFLLLPLLMGILLQYYLQIDTWSILFFLSGGIVMLYSFLTPPRYEYGLRWLFGVGLMVFVIGLGIVSISFRQQQTTFDYSGKRDVYKGIVVSTPKDKPNSLAYSVFLPQLDKKIMCYAARDTSDNKQLRVGDMFLFSGKISPFQNIRGTDNRFDYATYMRDKGFVGSTYIPLDAWQKIGESSSVQIRALKLRSKILSFYQSIGFSESAILAALTLGYQDDLSEDVVQAFRTTGTVHVLSVSGLHVGLIYIVIAFLLSFLRPNSKIYRLKPMLIILLLWFYAFITGLSPSVIRASIMLTVFSVSEIFDRRSYSIHALYITAFFMLLISPLSIFDIGFQLSFSSVFAILYLHPVATKKLNVKNKYMRNIWSLFTLSLVAQLATFPLCLYYFGTFPSYFFITNLLIVPLVSLIIYTLFAVGSAQLLSLAFTAYADSILYLPALLLKMLIKCLAVSIHFFENLPYALIENAYISFIELLLIFSLIFGLSIFFLFHKKSAINFSLLSALALIANHIICIL